MKIGSFLTASQNPNSSLTIMIMVRIRFGIMPLKDLTMERKRVEEFEETLMYRLWVNQSGFSLGFLSQNFLWKLSNNRG